MKFNFEMEASEMESMMSAITNAVRAYAAYEKDERQSRIEAESAKRREEITGTELRKAREAIEKAIK